MKKVIVVATTGLMVAVLASVSASASAGADDDLKPGGKGTITTYKSDKTTVVKVEACVKGACIKDTCMYKCMDAGKKADKFMREEWCKGNKGKKWYFQAGNRPPLENSCRK